MKLPPDFVEKQIIIMQLIAVFTSWFLKRQETGMLEKILMKIYRSITDTGVIFRLSQYDDILCKRLSTTVITAWMRSSVVELFDAHVPSPN